MHVLRTYNQDLARSTKLEDLQSHEVFIETDWAMKFIPLRESQSKWYGKRVLNWHITVASYRATAVDTEVKTAIVFDTIISFLIMHHKMQGFLMPSWRIP